MSKVLEELGLVGCVHVHVRPRPLVRRQGVVRRQQPKASLQVPVVHVVELVGRHHVVERGHGRFIGVVLAELPQPFCVFRVVGWVVLRGLAEVEEPVAELLAVREPNGMRSRQRYHFLHRKLLGSEDADHLGHRHGGSSQVAVHVLGLGDERVFAAEADRVVGPADHGDEVPSCRGEDVGARDDAGALQLEGGLGAGDEVEAIA